MSRFSDRARRHLEGWQLAVVAVGVALGGAALALPRAAAPRELPLPVVDRREVETARRASQARVEAARARPLPFLVRAAGDAFRRFGEAEARGDGAEAEALEVTFVARFADARKHHGDAPLLSLLAVQSDLFVKAATQFAASGGKVSPPDLDELGGTFSTLARTSHWIDDRTLGIEPDALGVMFRVRWAGLAGVLETFPFSPSLDDWRLYYRALLENPEAAPETDPTEAARPEMLDRYVTALAARDPDYPVALARGIVAEWSGRYDNAEELLVLYLNQHPTGSWRLRVQNYLLAARQQIAAPVEVRTGR